MKRNTKGQFIKKETAESLRARYIAAGEEIRANEVTIEARKNEIAQLEKEREELREKVRALGLDFFEASAEPKEDMKDPNNWRVGDLFINRSNFSFSGEIVKLVRKKGSAFICSIADATHPKSDGEWTMYSNELEFHSRPSK